MSTTRNSPAQRRVTSDAWFADGIRRPYDVATRQLVAETTPQSLHVWERVVAGSDPWPGRWITMLPGFPDGSYGYAQVDAVLGATNDPRL